MIKYANKMVCFQEVPDEISLSFSISNCPHRCAGCHSAYLCEDIGTPLTVEILHDELTRYGDGISCVLFMGGDDERQIYDLRKLLKYCKAKGYKTALYSGSDNIPCLLLDVLDYIKYGGYKKDLGGLNSRKTNQVILKRDGENWSDITYRFWKDDKNNYYK